MHYDYLHVSSRRVRYMGDISIDGHLINQLQGPLVFMGVPPRPPVSLRSKWIVRPKVAPRKARPRVRRVLPEKKIFSEFLFLRHLSTRKAIQVGRISMKRISRPYLRMAYLIAERTFAVNN